MADKQKNDKTESVSTNPNAYMHVSPNGLAFLIKCEGFEPLPYNDSSNNATIGIGKKLHDGPVTAADTDYYTKHPIEEKDALDGLYNRLPEYESYVKKIHVPLRQDSFDALLDLAYNHPQGVVDIAKKLNKYGPTTTYVLDNKAIYDEVLEVLLKIHHSGGLDTDGLKSRRAAEANIIVEGIESTFNNKNMLVTKYYKSKIKGVYNQRPHNLNLTIEGRIPTKSELDKIPTIYADFQKKLLEKQKGSTKMQGLHSGLHSVSGELYGSKEAIDNITIALYALVTKSQKYNQIFDIKSNVKNSASALSAPVESNNSQKGVQSITKLYVKLNWDVEGNIAFS